MLVGWETLDFEQQQKHSSSSPGCFQDRRGIFPCKMRIRFERGSFAGKFGYCFVQGFHCFFNVFFSSQIWDKSPTCFDFKYMEIT